MAQNKCRSSKCIIPVAGALDLIRNKLGQLANLAAISGFGKIMFFATNAVSRAGGLGTEKTNKLDVYKLKILAATFPLGKETTNIY